MGKKFDVHKLQLPVFNMSSLRVIYEDHRTYASYADVSPKQLCRRFSNSSRAIPHPQVFFLISQLSADKRYTMALKWSSCNSIMLNMLVVFRNRLTLVKALGRSWRKNWSHHHQLSELTGWILSQNLLWENSRIPVFVWLEVIHFTYSWLYYCIKGNQMNWIANYEIHWIVWYTARLIFGPKLST